MNADLKRWAEAKRMVPEAPVAASRSIAIGVASDVVWRLLTDVSRWPQWYGYLKNARLDGPFVCGTALTYGGLFKHRLRLAKIEPGKLAMLYGTMAGYTGITRWDVKSIAGAGTEVTFTESSDGPLIGLLYGNARLGNHLEQWLRALKMEAERVNGSFCANPSLRSKYVNGERWSRTAVANSMSKRQLSQLRARKLPGSLPPILAIPEIIAAGRTMTCNVGFHLLG